MTAENYKLNDVYEGDAVTLNNPTSGTFEDKNVGTEKKVTVTGLTLLGDDAGNYELAEDAINANIGEITAKPITVTADAKSKKENEADPKLTYTVNPELLDNDKFTGNLTREEGEDVGEYKIMQGNLSAGDNYTITFVGATFSILQSSTGISENRANNIAIYPTVTENGFTVEGSTKCKYIEIFNISGAKVLRTELRSNKQFVNISNLKAGMYIIKTGDIITKIIKM